MHAAVEMVSDEMVVRTTIETDMEQWICSCAVNRPTTCDFFQDLVYI